MVYFIIDRTSFRVFGDIVMHCLISFHKCRSCNGHHDFYLEGPEGFSVTHRYGYKCPVTGESAVMKPEMAHEIGGGIPKDAVEVREVKDDA